MIVKVFLLLLFFVYEVQNVTNTQAPFENYPPCDNKILIGFENTFKLEHFAFQKQINFLVNHAFEKWTHFNQLALSRYARLDYEDFGSFAFKSDTVTPWKNEFLFIPLSSKFNKTVVNHYFSDAKIVEWDIQHEDTPKDWETQFNDFYKCDQKTTTIDYLHTTKETPINLYPPCDANFAVAFDKSNGFTDQEYKYVQSFLVNHVFKKWTRFDKLNLYPFTKHIYSNVVPFKDATELTSFILDEDQVDSGSDLCIIFRYPHDIDGNLVIFLNSLNGTDFKQTLLYWNTCEELINLHTRFTFVLLNNELDINLLRMYIPQAQFVKLNLSESPSDWEWQFLTVFGCNEDDYNDQSVYPCNSKFIFAYDVSSSLNAQSNFLKEKVFNADWSVFENLALIAYSNETHVKDFGTLKNLNEVHSFIDDSTNQINVFRTSLCSVFKTLTTMYIRDVNIILFINEFHEQIGDECSIWISQLRNNLNFINFVNLTNQVDIQYFTSRFPQANSVSWNSIPDNWDVSSYGCQNFIVTGKEYPCNFNPDGNAIIYDRSRYLSPFVYQKLTNFLLKNVFIKQWSQISNLFGYPNVNGLLVLTDQIILELTIRQTLKSNEQPSFCSLLTQIKDIISTTNLIFFIGKFDQSIFDSTDVDCGKNVQNINTNPKATFIKLGLFNDTYLRTIFPNSTIVDWDIEKDKEPPEWAQTLWTAFGCLGELHIVFPTTSTPFVSTTKHLTTTKTTRVLLDSTTTHPLTTLKTFEKITSTHSIITTTKNISKHPSMLAILLGILVPLFIIFIFANIVFFYLYQKRKRDQMVDNMVFGATSENEQEYNETQSEDLWRIESENIDLFANQKLGSGASSNVYLGKLTGDSGIKLVYSEILALQHFCDCKIAVKTLPAYATESDKNDFKQEINFMKNLKYHQHVVCLLGYTKDYIVIEYCANGDLMNFLRRNKDNFGSEEGLKLKDLISFSWQIASGMEYFSSLNLIHRDLAARNVLLTNDLVCKISDFGLSRTNNVQFYASKKRLPVRWLPPEALKSSEYSTKTDVWSYAVLLYEIFTIGDFPYSELENTEILSHVEDGNRLPQPENATDEIYSIMTSCWTSASNQRPTFTQICQQLIPQLEQFNINYNYISPVETIVVEETNELAVFDDYFSDNDCVV